MRTGLWAAVALLAAGSAAAGADASAGQEAGTDQGGVSAGQAASQDRRRLEPRPPMLKEQFESTLAEMEAMGKAFNKAKTEAEREAIRQGRTDFYRSVGRLLDLVETNPKDPVARDVLLWIIGPARGNESDRDPWSGLMGRAVEQLLRHHANDPTVARATLALVEGRDGVSRNRDKLTRGICEQATDREAKGIACLALAKYLEMKAADVEYKDKPNWGKVYAMMGDGKGGLKRVELPNPYDDDYVKHLRSCDHRTLRQEAEDLYRRIIEEYGDVPHESARAEKRKLAEVAESRLNEMHNLAVGKPAPEIDGLDFDDKPRKLSDYRGKVVVLVFWGSWCGPCMREVPHERELVERLKGRPFALLGIDCDEDKEAAREAMVRERITWPNWQDGAPGEGPIAVRYHVEGYPATFVLDAEGIIRYRGVLGEGLDQAVDILLKEVEAKDSRK
jgi:thiol-disulfide isomerase/thioredoxin